MTLPEDFFTTDLSADEALARFKVVWEFVECGIILIDAETREIIDINPVATRMFGASKSRIVGHRCHRFLCPSEEHACPIMDLDQVVDRSERIFIKADASAIPIIKSVAKVMLNNRLTLLESFTDISPHKEAEENLRNLEVLERSNKLKTDFLSHISHEMRTPMNAIIGMTTIGQTSADSERKDYAFGRIGEASEQLLGIINDILDMSQIESGKFQLYDAQFDLRQTFTTVVEHLQHRIDEKRHHFEMTIDESIPTHLVGDGQRFAQVVTNLLANAIKFTPHEGSIKIAARLIENRADSCVVQVKVTDSGIGISPEVSPRLFKSFEQADTGLTRKFGGTGLGLAISKNIVERMGGDIWVESELGEGAAFIFNVELGLVPPSSL